MAVMLNAIVAFVIIAIVASPAALASNTHFKYQAGGIHQSGNLKAGLFRLTLLPTAQKQTLLAHIKNSKAKEASISLTQKFLTNLRTAKKFSSLVAGPDDSGAKWGLTLPLSPLSNVMMEYYTYVSVGNPLQTFAVMLDTGSTAAWIRGRNCTTSACTGARSFDATTSKTVNVSTERLAKDLEYGDGTKITGVFATDVVTIGFGAASVTMDKFSFLYADSITSVNAKSLLGLDGVFSLAMSSSDAQFSSRPNLIQNLLANASLPHTQFSYFVNATDDGGSLVLGGYDPALAANGGTNISFISTIPSFTVNNGKTTNQTLDGLWTVPINAITYKIPDFKSINPAISKIVAGVNSKGGAITLSPEGYVKFTYSEKAAAVLDSGTSLGLLPATIVDGLGNLIATQTDGNGTYVIPCALRKAKLLNGEFLAPILRISLGEGVNLAITPEEYIVPVPVTGADGSVSYACVLGFLGIPDTQNFAVLGNTFLKRYMTVFDYGTQKVGFTLAKGRSPLPNGNPSVDGKGIPNVKALPTSTAAPAPTVTLTNIPGADSSASTTAFPVVSMVVAFVMSVLCIL
ncbi:Vacuolar protease A [Phlyctochytrium planicorne]|nr:Vacuolar protease A [Phlyctochytrium planicorne]